MNNQIIYDVLVFMQGTRSYMLPKDFLKTDAWKEIEPASTTEVIIQPTETIPTTEPIPTESGSTPTTSEPIPDVAPPPETPTVEPLPAEVPTL